MKEKFKHYDETWDEFCLRSKRLIYIGIARGWVFPELAKTRKKYGTETNKENRKRNDLFQPQRHGESTEVQGEDRT